MKYNVNKKLRHSLLVGKVSVVLLVLIAFFRPEYSLPLLAWPLTVADQPQKDADVLIVLMGNPTVRPAAAARAVLAGYAPKLVLAECESNALEDAGLIPKESEIAIIMAQKVGLPKEKIRVVAEYGRISSTVEEAVVLKKYLETLDPIPHRVIIATSWFHASRAKWIFSKVLRDTPLHIEMFSVDEPKFTVNNWWVSESGLITVFEEYVKWGRYLVKYLGREVATT